MTAGINELSERISERMTQLRAVREILSESSECEISEQLIKSTDSMYRKLSDCCEEILKMKDREI